MSPVRMPSDYVRQPSPPRPRAEASEPEWDGLAEHLGIAERHRQARRALEHDSQQMEQLAAAIRALSCHW